MKARVAELTAGRMDGEAGEVSEVKRRLGSVSVQVLQEAEGEAALDVPESL